VNWQQRETGTAVTEWERADGYATIRLRERGDGSFVVRVERLFQAPEGETYRRERVDSRAAAEALVADWKTEFAGEE
jgi:hypothetical protein